MQPEVWRESHLFQRAVGAVPQERQQIWTVKLGVKANLPLVVFLAFVVVPLEEFMEVLRAGEIQNPLWMRACELL